MVLSKNTSRNDIRTLGYVLRRTNYGEADRILSLITPQGKVAVMAKGVRRAKSKLAGGIEMFTLADFNIHLGKSDLGVLTGAKMVRYHGGIVKDFERMELAGTILKKISLAAESSDSPEYFKIVDESLRSLDEGESLGLIEAWFLINLVRATGEEVNLYRDVSGAKLEAGRRYDFDGIEKAFSANENGEFGTNEIKMLRLMTSADLRIVRRVKIEKESEMKILEFARNVF